MIRTAPSSIGFEQTWLSHAAQADRLQVCFSLYSIQCEIDHSLAIIQSGEPAMKWPDVRKVSPWVWDQGNGLWFSNQWQLAVELKSGTLHAFFTRLAYRFDVHDRRRSARLNWCVDFFHKSLGCSLRGWEDWWEYSWEIHDYPFPGKF